MNKVKTEIVDRISDSKPMKAVRQTIKDLSDPEFLKAAGVVTKDQYQERSALERARRQDGS